MSVFPELMEIGCVLMSEKEEIGGFKEDEKDDDEDEVGWRGAGEDSDRNDRKDDEGSTLSGALEWFVLLRIADDEELEEGEEDDDDDDDVDREEREEERELLLETAGWEADRRDWKILLKKDGEEAS